jgi:hypothetical protein
VHVEQRDRAHGRVIRPPQYTSEDIGPHAATTSRFNVSYSPSHSPTMGEGVRQTASTHTYSSTGFAGGGLPGLTAERQMSGAYIHRVVPPSSIRAPPHVSMPSSRRAAGRSQDGGRQVGFAWPPPHER